MKLVDLLNDGSIQAQTVLDWQGAVVGIFVFDDVILRICPDETDTTCVGFSPKPHRVSAHSWRRSTRITRY